MMDNIGSEIWIYIFIAMVAIVLLYYLKNLFKQKVEIRKRSRSGLPLLYVGNLEMDNDGSAGEVRLPGSGSLPSIGRVIVDKQAGRECGFVETVATDVLDETVTPRYKQAGYICFNGDNIIDQYGYVYRQERGSKNRVMIGYCARPSEPNKPTIYGERNWRSLWLRCTLNFYLGKPDVEVLEVDEPEVEDTPAVVPAVVDDVPVDKSDDLLVDATEDIDDLLVDATEDEPADDAKDDAQAEDEPADEAKDDTQAEDAPVEKTIAHADKKKPSKKGKKPEKEAMASASFVGFHSSYADYLPAEARACAFAALSGDLRQGQYSEFYKAQPYGWNDTALLSSLIYSGLFLMLYFGYKLIGLSLISDGLEDIFVLPILMGMYYLIWMLVRMIKIDCIESSNSFQKTLDLLNKNLGLRGFNIAVLVLSPLAFYFSALTGNLDLIPLVWAILNGVSINMMLKGASTPWTISTSYNEKDSDRDANEEVENPTGDIACTYEWDLDATYSTQQLHGNLTLYFTAQDIADMRQCNPFFAQRKDKSDKDYILDMFSFLKEHRSFMARVRYIAKYIDESITQSSLTPMDKIQFTLDFVQEPNIRFVNNKDCKNVNNYEDYIRYPDETLYDKEGDCNSKSLLAAMLFYVMGHNVMYLSSRKYNHAAIGIEVNAKDIEAQWYGSNINDMTVRENGKYYIFCETTGDRFRIGKPIDGMSVSDFEEKMLLTVDSTLPTDDIQQQRSIIYNWDLTAHSEATLHGNLVLKFNNEEIETLRSCNPFRTYGYDQNTYQDNVRSMFNYLCDDDSRSENVKIVADYIKARTEGANLSELDMVQFVFNFVQVPNITYRMDDECQSIGYQKEYMRFPDETLYDKEGDCDCKSFLAANILHCLGYNVIYLLSNKLKHAAIAVECKDEWLKQIGAANIDNVLLEHNGRKYIFSESTGEYNKVGDIKDGESIKDFETIIELAAAPAVARFSKRR